MKRLLTFTLLGLLLASGACDTGVDGCGPFKDKFKTIGFTTAAYRIEDGDSLVAEPALFPIENDTLSAGELAIRMVPHKELYFSSSKATSAISFVSAAYACSPPIPSSDEVIRDIQVYSDQSFNDEYAAGDNLADLFDVVVFNQASRIIYDRFDLNDFLAREPNAVDEMVLVLDAAPQTTSSFQFTVRYFQEGRGLDYYEVTTETVVLQSD